MGIKPTTSTKTVFRKVKRLSTDVETQNRKSLFDAGKQLKKTLDKDVLKKPKGGRTYFRRDKAGRRRKHVASAPGKSWANRSGKARRGVEFRVVGSDKLYYENEVFYVFFLESGTRLMKPRPAMLNSIKKNKSLNLKIIDSNVSKALFF